MVVINDKKNRDYGAKDPPKIHFPPIAAKIGGGGVCALTPGVMPLFGFVKIYLWSGLYGVKNHSQNLD